MKKIGALILIFCFMSTIYPFVANGDSDYIDVDDIGYTHEFEIIEQLGIMTGYDDATYRPSQPASRAEFAVGAAKLFRIEPIEAKGYFSDVSNEQEAAGAIYALSERGLISKNSELFRPEDQISLNEALKILLSGMGYDALANAKGGYPTGYLSVANTLKLMTNIPDKLNRAAMARLLYRALNTSVLDIHSIGVAVEFTADENKTVLTEFWHMKFLSGQLTDDGTTSVLGESRGLKHAIIVDGLVVETTEENTDWQGLVGYMVDAYLYDNDGSYTLGAIIPSPNCNNSITLLSENLTGTIGLDAISAFVDDNGEDFSLADNFTLIYNNEFASGFDSSWLLPEEGSVRLLDLNNDDVYELVFVTDLIDDIVQGVNLQEEILLLKDQGQILLTDGEYRVIANGQEQDLSYIANGDAVSVAKSQTGFITVYASSTHVQGVLNEWSENRVVIGEQSYPISARLAAKITEWESTYGQKMFTLSSNYDAAISSSGKLVELTSVSGVDQYGFLMGMDTGKGIDNRITLKVLTKDSEIAKLVCAEKVRIDNAYYVENEELPTIGIAGTISGVTPQVILYRLNDKGELSHLQLAQDRTAQGIDTDVFSLDHAGGVSTRIYKYNIGINYRAGSGTVVFKVPPEQNMASASDEDYSAGGVGTLSSDFTTSSFKLYDTQKDRSVAAMVLYETPPSASTTMTEDMQRREPALVEKITTATNAEGETATKLYLLSDKKEVEIFAKEPDLTSTAQDNWDYRNIGIHQLNSGDVIQYDVNGKGLLSSFTILFRASPLPETFQEILPGSATIDENNDARLTYLHTVYGRVKEINGLTLNMDVRGTLSAENPDPALRRYATMNSTTRIYIYNSKTNEAILGTTTDIAVEDIIFTRLYNYVPTTVIIYR